MRYFKKISGGKVYLSPVNPDDAEIYTKWANDWEVARHTTFYQRVIPLQKERRALEKLSEEYNFAIVAIDGDVLLGNCGIFDINQRSRTAEVGIFIGEEEYRGRGYGTEAMKLLVNYGFDTLNIRNIMLCAHADNPRAIASYKKAGFREFGRRTGAHYGGGKYIDLVFMEILNV